MAGKLNAIVVKAQTLEPYHVYGKKVDVGLPMVVMLLPAPGWRGAPAWLDTGAFSLPEEEYHGDFTFEVPFTPRDLFELREQLTCLRSKRSADLGIGRYIISATTPFTPRELFELRATDHS